MRVCWGHNPLTGNASSGLPISKPAAVDDTEPLVDVRYNTRHILVCVPARCFDKDDSLLCASRRKRTSRRVSSKLLPSKRIEGDKKTGNRELEREKKQRTCMPPGPMLLRGLRNAEGPGGLRCGGSASCTH